MDEVLWAVGRMSGMVSLLLFTASVVLGLLTRRGAPLPGLPRFATAAVHRSVSLLAAIFLLLHVLTLLGDSYAKLSLLDLVVPFLGQTDPFWLGLGTVALDLLLAVILTSLLRLRLPAGVFRAVHWLVYPMWALALFHAIGNGSDSTSAWFLLAAGGSLLTVRGAVLWRLVDPGFRTHPEDRSARAERRETRSAR